MSVFRDGFGMSQILQVNATVIAGILVLMTVGPFHQPAQILSGALFKTINQNVSFTLVYFSISSLSAIIALVTDMSNKTLKFFTWLSVLSMIGGFIWLIFIVILIGAS